MNKKLNHFSLKIGVPSGADVPKKRPNILHDYPSKYNEIHQKFGQKSANNISDS
jgi:hypothetical protein